MPGAAKCPGSARGRQAPSLKHRTRGIRRACIGTDRPRQFRQCGKWSAADQDRRSLDRRRSLQQHGRGSAGELTFERAARVGAQRGLDQIGDEFSLSLQGIAGKSIRAIQSTPRHPRRWIHGCEKRRLANGPHPDQLQQLSCSRPKHCQGLAADADGVPPSGQHARPPGSRRRAKRRMRRRGSRGARRLTRRGLQRLELNPIAF